VACLVPIAACSTDRAVSATTGSTTSSSTEATTTAAVGTSPTGRTTTVSTVAVTVPPTELLHTGVSRLAESYHFRSTITVNGAVSLTAVGDRVGASSRLDLTSKGATVSYIITPAGSWARPEGGDWSKLDAAPATADPIVALQHPTKVVAVSSGADVDRLRVTVPATALGVGTSGTADVTVVVTHGAITHVEYTEKRSGGTATVSNDFTKVTDATPITAPK
jgi:hypothetical protein